LYPSNGPVGIDTTTPFAWSNVPQAQAYMVIIGTKVFAQDLYRSPVLPSGQSSLLVPAMPAGPTIYATLLAEINGTWMITSAVSFFAIPVGRGALSYPANGEANVVASQPFTWTSVPQAQAYLLIVGTTQYGTNVAISGILPPTQSGFLVPSLPDGKDLYATLFTEVNGAWTLLHSVYFGTPGAPPPVHPPGT
jgi:hypothetical protein